MKKKINFIIAIVILLTSFRVNAQIERAAPEYATQETKEIIEKVINAHGGWDKWADAPTISYDNIFFNTGAKNGQNPWWVSYEVIEQSSERRTYHEWPILNAALAFDGQQTWATENFRIGNQPKFMAHFFYYFLNLPWLTQDSNVKLGPVEKKIYGNAYFKQEEREVYTILMTFREAPSIGKTDKDFYRLYIDPSTYTIVAYEYGVGYGAMLDLMGLPKDREFLGPVFRHIDVNTTTDGLVFPSQMHTTNTGQSVVYGQHVLFNYSISKKFNTQALEIPKGAVIDNSSSKRNKKSE